MLALELFFAGLKDIFLHLSIAGAAIALCLVLAYFSPVGRKACLYLAFAILLFVVGEVFGLKDEHARAIKQEAAVQTTVDKAVKKTETSRAKKSSDPWDNRNY